MVVDNLMERGFRGVRMGQKNAFSFNSLKPNVGFVLCQGFFFLIFSPPLFGQYCFLHNNTVVAVICDFI